jgi:EAL domain-containing protein (putative c-di-GMP-specific phosphodiesterase class I)
LSVVAEGIETETQRRRSHELGCELGQGFLFAKPQPPAEMTELLAGASAYRSKSS